MIKHVFTAVLLSIGLVLAGTGQSALAQDQQRIAAIVNDDLISVHDLKSRMALVIATSNLPDTPETQRRLLPQVLQKLVNDSLIMQEARRLNIVVTKAEIDSMLTNIERQLKVPPGQLAQVVAANGVDIATLIDEVEAEIAWHKAVSELEGNRLNISDDEIDRELARLQGSAGKTEYRIAEIVIPVDDPSQEAEMRQLAERLVEEIRGGANFSLLARNFSRSATAVLGGDMGWVQPSQLSAELEQAIRSLQPGQISPPIRTQSGFHILLMVESRTVSDLAAGAGTVTMTLHQVALPLSPNPTSEEASRRMKQVVDLTASATTCAELDAIGAANPQFQSTNLGTIELDKLPGEIQGMLRPLQVGGKTPPFRAGNGVGVLMVCAREDTGPGADQRARIERTLSKERHTAASLRHLRDLRRAAFVEVRI